MINSILNAARHPRKPRTVHQVNGIIHRDDGPAIESEDYREFRIHGRLHRADGPAIEDSTLNTEEWWLDNKRHREDGPAVRRGLAVEFWIHGQRLTEVEFLLRKPGDLQEIAKKAITKRDKKLIFRQALELGLSKKEALKLSESTPEGRIVTFRRRLVL